MGQHCCGIYDQRPEACRRYPELGSYVPATCTYHFSRGERRGECSPECGASCCMLPREGGEPGGVPLPEIAGGEPCKHIIYADRRSKVSGDGEANPPAGGDREEPKQGSDPVELVLAEKRRSERDGTGTS